RVVTSTGGRGGYAERAVAAAGDLHRVPGELHDAEAAALLADGRTALALTSASAIRRGEAVAGAPAGGGVRSLIVPLAAGFGARVGAVAGNARKPAHARNLGAAHTFDYTGPDWVQCVDDTIGRLDVVFDGVGGRVGEGLAARTGVGSRYVQHGAASGEWPDI